MKVTAVGMESEVRAQPPKAKTPIRTTDEGMEALVKAEASIYEEFEFIFFFLIKILFVLIYRRKHSFQLK